METTNIITGIGLALLTSFLFLLLLDSLTLQLFARLLRPHPRMQPTKFHCPFGLPERTVFPAPAVARRPLNHKTQNYDPRYEYVKALGVGCEGSTCVYRDLARGGEKVVIKRFFRGVRKNPVPPHLAGRWDGAEKWPADIPATLYFANASAPGEFETGGDERRRSGTFIYALDYFWVADEWTGCGWRLVTPFLRYGTLETLAELVRRRGMAPGEVDAVYRRRFRGILVALAEMHLAGYCHDDVKMDNIFISPINTFLLGDLGNVREHTHDYHRHSPDVHTGNTDFRRGDTERAVRSYLSFLRHACGDKSWFDREFHARDAAWSDFYWRYKRAPATAEELLTDDPFWAEGAGADEAQCMEFEAAVDEMREQVLDWKSGAGVRPQWHREPDGKMEEEEEEEVKKEVGMRVRVEREGNMVAREVDGELACVSVSVFEKLLPWKRKLPQSSY